MRVAVTGGNGFIGRAVVAQLATLGHDALVLDRPECDVRKLDTLGPLWQTDAVIHLAGLLGTAELWKTAEKAIDVNVRGTLNVLNACKLAHTRYVGITMPDCWANVYQATKHAAQTLALGFHRDFELPVTHICAFNAYGAGQAHGAGHPQKIIPTFATKAFAGEPLPIWGDGEQTVDLVHVDHIAACLVDAAVSDSSAYGHGQVWDAGSGIQSRVIDVAHRVAHAAGIEVPELEHLPMRAGETPRTFLCATVPGPVGFDGAQRLAEVVQSYAPAEVHA